LMNRLITNKSGELNDIAVIVNDNHKSFAQIKFHSFFSIDKKLVEILKYTVDIFEYMMVMLIQDPIRDDRRL